MDNDLDPNATPGNRRKPGMTDAEFLRAVAHVCDIGDPVEHRDVERLRELANLLERFAGLRRVERLLDTPCDPGNDGAAIVEAIRDELRKLGVQFGFDAADCVRTGLVVLVQLEER